MPLEWVRIGRLLNGNEDHSKKMLNFWSKDSSTLSQSTIKEANDQMHAMHCRIVDLEQRVREQSELLERRDHQHAARFEDMKRKKDLELTNMQRELTKMDEKCSHLEKAVRERDVNIAYLLHRREKIFLKIFAEKLGKIKILKNGVDYTSEPKNIFIHLQLVY